MPENRIQYTQIVSGIKRVLMLWGVVQAMCGYREVLHIHYITMNTMCIVYKHNAKAKGLIRAQRVSHLCIIFGRGVRGEPYTWTLIVYTFICDIDRGTRLDASFIFDFSCKRHTNVLSSIFYGWLMIWDCLELWNFRQNENVRRKRRKKIWKIRIFGIGIHHTENLAHHTGFVQCCIYSEKVHWKPHHNEKQWRIDNSNCFLIRHFSRTEILLKLCIEITAEFSWFLTVTDGLSNQRTPQYTTL